MHNPNNPPSNSSLSHQQLEQALKEKEATLQENSKARDQESLRLQQALKEAQTEAKYLRAENERLRTNEKELLQKILKATEVRVPETNPPKKETPPPGTKKSIPTLSSSDGGVLLWCPAGRFWMGSQSSDTEAYADEKPSHLVTLPHGFWLKKTLVTQAEWKLVMGFNPSRFVANADKHPVESVTWYHTLAFCNELSRLEGLEPAYDLGNASDGKVEWFLQSRGYRLPTEAEWEYACRAGTTTPRYHAPLDEIAWYSKNSEQRTHVVGTKKANPWGFYDMLGNVWEWCWNRYGSHPFDGSSTSANRIYRGGSWYQDAGFARAAYRRQHGGPAYYNNDIGFRIARSL